MFYVFYLFHHVIKAFREKQYLICLCLDFSLRKQKNVSIFCPLFCETHFEINHVLLGVLLTGMHV